MPSEYRDNGADFDQIFEPRGTSTKIADVNMRENGVDLSEKYYGLVNGGTSPSPTNYRSNGVDLANLFAALGSVVAQVTMPAGFLVSAFSLAPSTATASLNFENDGDIIRNSSVDVGDWVDNKSLIPGGTADEYEIIAVLVSGPNPTTGAMNTYQDLNVNRFWTVSRSTVGTTITTIDVTIREKANHSNQATTTVTFSVEVEP